MLPCQEDNRSFFQKLQSVEGLDLRDNRGKRHDLAVVLVGVMIALLSNRDGNLSSIRRHVKNHYEQLVAHLGVEKKKPVSRAQLPLILARVSVTVFDQTLFAHYGIKLNEAEREWFAIDGKERARKYRFRSAARRSGGASDFALWTTSRGARLLLRRKGIRSSNREKALGSRRVSESKDQSRCPALQTHHFSNDGSEQRQILGGLERKSKTTEETS